MNYGRRVFHLVLIFTLILLTASFLAQKFHWNWHPLNRVSLLEDITRKTPIAKDTLKKKQEEVVVVKENGKRFELALYHRGKLITDFNVDTTQPSLHLLQQKLYTLKKTRKGKVRIAYFGDSMIEGDLISMTFRKLLQEYFGGGGVGFVPITSPVAGFRTTVFHSFSGWDEKNFKTENSANNHLYLSGHSFSTSDGYVTMTDRTVKDSALNIQKSLICGPGSGRISVNGQPVNINRNALVNRVILEQGPGHYIKVGVANPSLPIYGISFESEDGVIVDNFSFRGVSGTEFARIDTALLQSASTNNPYDLIILQYGVNLMFRPNDKNYSWYSKVMKPSLARLQSCFPNTNILIISASDRAFRYGSEYKTAVGIDSLIRIQADMAYNSGCAFYNMYQTMGGEGTIVSWANETPALANKDYVHPNFRGADKLGHYLFDALINDFQKYNATVK